jgi:hypothetical protein
MRLHPNEVNNIAYVACWFGHGIIMDGQLWLQIKLELGDDVNVARIVNVASDFAWRLNGRPDKQHYMYTDRVGYAEAIATQFMSLPVEVRQDINKVVKHDLQRVILNKPTAKLLM